MVPILSHLNIFYQQIVFLGTVPVNLFNTFQNARHLEVQLLADEYGTAISLFR
jgi:hypothetical protein